MEYSGCQGCVNYQTVEIEHLVSKVCMANVNNPIKCVLRKRVLNEDIAEFFYATCERYRKE